MKKISKIILALFLLICLLLYAIVISASTWGVQYYGSCGKNESDNVTWKMMQTSNPELINNYSDYERLVIGGTGEMRDYTQYTNGKTTSPWYEIIWDTNSIVVENGITHIGNNAFIGADSICYLSLPETLESIGEYAFSSALKRVKQITIPENVNYIGRYALCSNAFTDVEILGDVTVLQEGVFSFCTSLKSITIPKSVTSIEDDAFCYCTSLKDVYYGGTRDEWEEINIGNYNSSLLNATVHFPTVNVESVSLDRSTKTIFVGSAFTLTATVLPTNADNKIVSWKSSDSTIATVDNGVVTAISPGTATITVTTADGNKIDTCTVSVQASTVSVTGVSLNKTELTIQVGDAETLIATVLPANATNKNVTWTSSNTSVATVSNGIVTAKSAGTATITVKTADCGMTASCDVTVKALITEPVVWVYTEAKNSVVQGSEFTYKVYLAGTYDGYVFELVQPAGLTITNVEATSSGVNIDNIDGTWMISVIGGLEKQEAEKEEIITVTASVAKDAALGDRTLSLAEVIITTEFGEEISAVEYNYATITVTDQIPGDVNGDGKFNYTDVSKLYAFFRKKTTVSENVDTDINGDGKFNYTDVSKLYAIFRKKADFN